MGLSASSSGFAGPAKGQQAALSRSKYAKSPRPGCFRAGAGRARCYEMIDSSVAGEVVTARPSGPALVAGGSWSGSVQAGSSGSGR